MCSFVYTPYIACSLTADEEDQLMSLDAAGKPVAVAKPASAKAAANAPSKIKTSSSTSQSLPSQKQKGSASGNKSTAASQRPSSGKAVKDRPPPITILNTGVGSPDPALCCTAV